MKLLKKSFSFLVIFMLLMSCINVYATSSSNVFEYPVRPGMAEWKNLKTHAEMVEACQIPEEVLKSMSTEELSKAVMDYPLFVDIFLFNTSKQGYDTMYKRFNALQELLIRDDAPTELLKRYSNLNEGLSSEISMSSQKNNIILKKAYLEIILTQDKIASKMKQQGLDNMISLSGKTSSVSPQYITTVTTPNGTAVQVYVDPLESQSYLDAIDQQVRDAYPLATFVRDSDNRYNCHSYAWYSQSTSNVYWMNDPSAYMNDGSYSYQGTIPSATNQKVFYANGDHSGIVKSYDSSRPYDKGLIQVQSKWGQGPLLKHAASYSPYADSTLKYYE